MADLFENGSTTIGKQPADRDVLLAMLNPEFAGLDFTGLEDGDLQALADGLGEIDATA